MDVPRRRRTGVWVRVALVTVLVAAVSLLASQLPAGALTVTGTPSPVTGNSTYFDGLGQPYGGCGLPQANLDSQDFVALNVFNTPGDYGAYPRPLPASLADKMGMWDNGLNCGRYVQVTVGNYCTGVNDGAQNQPFCRNGSWVSDAYNGATLTMLVADSCGDSNAWCRDDPYHLDLHKDSLNRFVKNGAAVGDLYPNHFNNRQIQWQFVSAPNYSGDIQIGFLQGAQSWWGAIAISHLPNGIHGVEYQTSGGGWQSATMDSDMGQAYIVSPTTAGGTQFQIRVRDSSDTLVNNGRVYTFSLPSSCSSQCSAPYSQATYTTTDPGGPTGGPSPSPSRTTSPSPSPSPSRTTSPSPSPSRTTSPSPSAPSGGPTCDVNYQVSSTWPGGFTSNVTVTNRGSTTWNNWAVAWTMPAGVTLTGAWSSTITTSGSAWTITAPSWATSLAPGASTSFGFQANGSSTPPPSGIRCG
ncbi:cellulose binding domain-containing protein [Rugosimonospora acidiphila]|uniref:Cellulose binding domain-containing protein n=1 Tax=Rugosimonospora acidiphila TaxID=556531 RepID=A0ABP9RVZ7_9ACTN